MAIPLSWPNSHGAWTSFLQRSGLNPATAARALYLAWWVKQLGGVELELESAYRSPEYQKQLQQRWDRGDRAGLKVRPATNSLHSEGRAFDVGAVGPDPSSETWRRIGSVGESLGLSWGGRFQTPDPVHF